MLITIFLYGDIKYIENTAQKIWLWKGTFIGDLIFFVVVSAMVYVIGVIISFASSLSVEKFFIYYLDYPSKILTSPNFKTDENIKNYITRRVIIYIRSPYFWIFSTLFLPITLTLCFLWLTGLIRHLISPMHPGYVYLLCVKFNLRASFRIFPQKMHLEKDWFKFVDYYTRIFIPQCYERMYNYVVLYGLLRSITFIFCLTFNITFLSFIFSIINNKYMQHGLLLSLFIQLVLCGSCFCAFFKFFRRYTEEAIYGFSVFVAEGEDRAEVKQLISKLQRKQGDTAEASQIDLPDSSMPDQ